VGNVKGHHVLAFIQDATHQPRDLGVLLNLANQTVHDSRLCFMGKPEKVECKTVGGYCQIHIRWL
jgi:hypothetical protein